MKQITVYYFPPYIMCGECGQLMQQEDDTFKTQTQRWAIVACKNFYARRDFPIRDQRNNCVNYGVRVKVLATEKMFEVFE